MAEDWSRLKDHIADVLSLPPEQRRTHVDRVSRASPQLRAELEDWLRSAEQAADFLERPLLPAAAPQPRHLQLGTRVGRYRILQILGVGGMGVVYEARQDEPDRRVALKVLHAADASPDSLRRFVREAELAGRLQHPGIAQVFEAGTHRAGPVTLPFIAMERVADGRSIVDHAQAHALSLQARLRLFVDVCTAVGYAHSRGVVHRDLKPENILVDGEGRPRVIDFGIAKLCDDGVETRLTLHGDVWGTLDYMSPEQCRSDATRIDPSTDVYGLGAVLFELCCGTPPFPRRHTSIRDAIDVICTAPAMIPQPQRATLDRDLQAILLRALHKDQARRYPSATELARDLACHLQGLPVAAREPSLAYHASLFVRRHRTAVLTVVLTLLALLATGVGVAAHLVETARTETRERRKAEQVTAFLQSVLELASPSASRKRDFSMLEALDSAAARVDAELADYPRGRAEIHATLGMAYCDLGRYAEAERHLRTTVSLYDTLPDQRTVAGCARNALGDVLNRAGRSADAVAVLRQGAALFTALESPPVLHAMCANKLATALRQTGELDEAERLVRSALTTYEHMFPPGHEAIGAASLELAAVLAESEQTEAAEELARRAVVIYEQCRGAGSLAAARARLRLGLVLRAAGRSEVARAELRRAAADFAALLPSSHPETRAAQLELEQAD